MDAEQRWTRKHLLGLEELSADEIRFILDTAKGFAEVSTRSIKNVPALRGRGAHTALIAARLRAAAAAGATLATVCARPGGESHRHLDRAGFTVGYTRPSLARAWE